MCKIDLNGDGLEDLIVSLPISMGGTGGLPYLIFLKRMDGKYDLLRLNDDISVIASILAIEQHNNITYLWGYNHFSSQEGVIWNYSFKRDGTQKMSGGLVIRPGDGGSSIGNAIYQSIFNDKSVLRFQVVE